MVYKGYGNSARIVWLSAAMAVSDVVCCVASVEFEGYGDGWEW